ncbi:hypothetical protein IT575_14165 [bacterium]|nr:hypothetical protein [bacterium]
MRFPATIMLVTAAALLLVACGGGNTASRLDSALNSEQLAGLPKPAELRGISGQDVLNLSGTTTVRQSPGFDAPVLEPGVGVLDASDGGDFE